MRLCHRSGHFRLDRHHESSGLKTGPLPRFGGDGFYGIGLETVIPTPIGGKSVLFRQGGDNAEIQISDDSRSALNSPSLLIENGPAASNCGPFSFLVTIRLRETPIQSDLAILLQPSHKPPKQHEAQT